MSTSGDARTAPSAEPALHILLARFPNSYVAAISDTGVAVPVPVGVPIDQHQPLKSTFDVILPEDHGTIVKLYARSRATGVAAGPVRLLEDPNRTVMVYIADARLRYGALIVVFGDDSEDPSELLNGCELPQLPPRLARAHKDGSAVFTEVDDALCLILGWSRDQLVGRRALEIIHPDDRDTAIANWVEMLAAPGPGRRVRLRHQHSNGQWIWLEIANRNRLDDAQHGDVVADMVDITEEMAAHEAIRAREQLLTELAQTVPLGLFHADRSGRLLFANERLRDMLEIERFVEIDDLTAAIEGEDRDKVSDALAATLTFHTGADVEFRISSGDAIRYGSLRLRALVNPNGALSGLIGCVEDVTETVLMRQRLEVQATFDSLTGCHNRASTMRAVDGALVALGEGRISGVAVVYIDIDRFKSVNDDFGHPAGDQLLKVVADRLARSVRSGDVIGRMGGDEFAIVCSGVNTAPNALKIAETTIIRLCGDCVVGDIETEIRASAGVAWTDDLGTDPDLLVARADAAMYRSKRDGRCAAVLAESP